ncbi:MAG: hypothetical protein B7733_07620 [Myxococcales bacterium FL481]|nr:MAG: hypothetical protein B7733_07620 [Myxococcales bacterium FL481]
MTMAPDETLEVLAMLRRGRLAIDACESGRTTFLSHVGAVPKLVPGPWIGHRDLLRAMALANLHPQQRASLARAVLVEYGHTFGVGRLELTAHPSGLPLGGSSVWLRSRTSEVTCLYTWGLGPSPTAVACDWLVLRARPGWALDKPFKTLSATGLSTLFELAGKVLVVVETAVSARLVADLVQGQLDVTAHARFAPYVESSQPDAPLVLWPADALDSSALARFEFGTAIPLELGESETRAVSEWAEARANVTVASACEPNRLTRKGLERFWRACGRPKILVRGEPSWTAEGAAWLRRLGASVHVEPTSTQLGLF